MQFQGNPILLLPICNGQFHLYLVPRLKAMYFLLKEPEYKQLTLR